MNTDGFILDTPGAIEAYRLLALRGALSLECQGMRRSHGPSVATIVKREFNLKGRNTKVLADFEVILRERGILRA
jgi:hypothetical protein